MSRSTLLETANAVIQAYNTWTVESVLSFRAPNCIQQILPLSLGRQPLNNEQYGAYFAPMMPAFKDFHLTVANTVVDEEARQVVMHASSTASTEIGEYKNEYILVLHMTEDVTQVELVEEFVDSKYGSEFMARLRAHLAAKQK